MSTFDIIVIGSGIVGTTAALALAKNTSLSIAIIDSQLISPEWQENKMDHRVSAISLASQRIFQRLAVWEKMTAKRTSPYSHMHVWEENGKSAIDFDCADVHERALGYIVEDSVMRTSLFEAVRACSNINLFCPIKLTRLQQKPDCIELIADTHDIYAAKLVIAADGANSWVREQLGVDLKTYDYNHTAIVATVKTSQPHLSTAWQRFLKTGPLAFLPLSDSNTSSIVWSAIPEYASELLVLDDADFKKRLAAAFEEKLGEVVAIEKRYHFPLRMRHAKNYVRDRIALIGDAAHTIHPLAGQGVNLGLLDAISLVETITNAKNKQRDFASISTLRRYERWRKGDNLAMLAMVEFLKYLFASEKMLIQSLRRLGLAFTGRVSFVKNFFVNHAIGNRGDLPEMATRRPVACPRNPERP